jgi:hypothetical protein
MEFGIYKGAFNEERKKIGTVNVKLEKELYRILGMLVYDNDSIEYAAEQEKGGFIFVIKKTDEGTDIYDEENLEVVEFKKDSKDKNNK